MGKLSFCAWVKKAGVKKVAFSCDVGEHQVRKWLNGKACPRPYRISDLVRQGKGAFKEADVIMETTRALEK